MNCYIIDVISCVVMPFSSSFGVISLALDFGPVRLHGGMG